MLLSTDQKKQIKDYAGSPVSDTGLVDMFVHKVDPGQWTDANKVRGGSVLVLVIATADLRAEETLTGEMLDPILQAIRTKPEERDALIGGTFCLVTDNEEPAPGQPDRRYIDWPGAVALSGTVGFFDRAKAYTAFIKALEAGGEDQWPPRGQQDRVGAHHLQERPDADRRAPREAAPVRCAGHRAAPRSVSTGSRGRTSKHPTCSAIGSARMSPPMTTPGIISRT